MPSDPRFAQALAAMARPIAEFRSLVQGAITQAEVFLAEQVAGSDERTRRASVELGRFAQGRIDAARFAALFPSVPPANADALAALNQALDALRTLAEKDDSAFIADLPKGGRLGASVGDALAEIGRAFGAVKIADLVRGGRYQPVEHDRLLAPLDFHSWTKTERRYAPPLIVSLDGADLHAGALTDYADGREKIVLVVRGAAPPAPLARCITPGTLVLQTTDGSGLDRVAAFDGPAVAAVMPEGAAVFLHDPTAGREAWQRLTLRGLGDRPKRAVGGTSVWQMGEDRNLLAELARTPFTVPAKSGPPTPAAGATDAVDRIAAWLLDQSGLPGH